MNRLLNILLVCLLHVSWAVASTYKLSVEVTPNGAGSLNLTSGIYEEGNTINLRTSGNTGYVFKGWYEGETLVSSVTSFNYKMPSKDVVLQARYDYDPTVPDNPAMPDTTTYFTLTTSVSPEGAASLNTNGGKYAANAQINLRAYGNTGYKFIAWKNESDQTVSTSTSFNYYMPKGNSHLTALYTYDPDVPANPDSTAQKSTVTLHSKPNGGGSFNTNSVTETAGSNVRLYAYTNTGYNFLHWENEKGEIISSSREFYYVIPHSDSKIYGVFEFDPPLPGNPAKNFWDKETGELIVDDFTEGRLNNAVSEAIKGSNSSEVTMITVAGRINSNDFGIANSYQNCSLLDLSRVAGVTEVPSYAFDGTNLVSVYLPASIEKIGYRAFEGCESLTSITCYAMTPPVLEDRVFENTQEGLIVYVPAAAIAQYQDAEGWKDFTILPIQEDIRSITVSLPESINPKDFSQMWLELINQKSGQRLHYIMTDKSSYTFSNIICNTSWNIIIRNERGDVFGQIENVEIKDEDVTTTFTALSKPQNVTLSVLTPESEDVTSQVQIAWTDTLGNYLVQGAQLSGLPVGYQVKYKLTLGKELAMKYNLPAEGIYTIQQDNNTVPVRLTTIGMVELSGCVKDIQTNSSINGATISASQTFAGKYTNTVTTKTNSKGEYTLTVFGVPTTLTVAATDYISQTHACDTLVNGEQHVQLNDVLLKPITGATVSLAFTYTPSVVEGETAEKQEWYSDYNNVDYTIYNKTQQKSITQFNVQYPKIVLLEEVATGDEIELTATSRIAAFTPVKATAIISKDQQADATFPIVELGKIQASFTKNSNEAVVAMLYDETEKYIKSYNYTNASIAIDNLQDGTYTLVTMGSSKLFNTIYDLKQLPNVGLTINKDYVQHKVEVKSGCITTIAIEEVPILDESKLYYTGENTSFTVNKPSIVIGNYLTLTGKLDFKPSYSGNVRNVQMIVDIPEKCSFVENSVMVGNSISSYTLNGHRLTTPMSNSANRVRFCVIPTDGGEYAPTAYTQFELNGSTVLQPIGSAHYTAQNLSIKVPSTVAKTKIPISGTAIGKSTIEIYDNDVLIGQTTSLANGVWSTTCELNEPYNLSMHRIYAKAQTTQGLTLNSETAECMYDMNAIEVSKVTMINISHRVGNYYEEKTIFDFLNPATSIPPYWYWPDYPEFTFLIDFTNNDTTKISDVVLYVKTSLGRHVPLKASFDTKHNQWIASGKFGSWSDSERPVNVSIDYNVDTEYKMDATLYDSSVTHYSKIKEEYETNVSNITKLIEELKCEEDSVKNDSIKKLIYAHLNYIYNEDSDCEPITEESIQKLINSCDSVLNDSLSYLKNGIFSQDIWEVSNIMEGIKIEKCNNIVETDLLDQGYIRLLKTDGTEIYVLTTTTKVSVIDKHNNIHYTINIDLIEDLQYLPTKANRTDDFASAMNEYMSILKDGFERLRSYMTTLAGTIDDIERALDVRNKKIANLVMELDENITYLKANNGNIILIKELEAQYNLLLKEAVVNNNILGWIHKNISTDGLKIGRLGGAFAAFDIFMLKKQMLADLNDVINAYYNVPVCDKDNSETNKYRNAIKGMGIAAAIYYSSMIISDASQIALAITGGAAAIVSGGTSLSAVGVAIGLAAANIAASELYSRNFSKNLNKLAHQASSITCDDDDNEDGNEDGNNDGNNDDDNNGYGHISGNPDAEWQEDPSGYVYEGVFSNRLEGVTATCFYKEIVEDMYGDKHENIVKWDAEEYAQENPLFTDENGYYRWDVPQGLWQVKFEKEGYETTYSEWLPVPPPQLEVNIAMTQNRQPEVKTARAFGDAVEIEFDKYMMPELLTTDNIFIMDGDHVAEGNIVLLNEEVSYEGESTKYASKVRFNSNVPFAHEEITLHVSNRVKSYAGIRMEDDFVQKFPVELEVSKIGADSTANVFYGDSINLTISVLPAKASAGKVLTVRNTSSMILGVDQERVIIDEKGNAVITVHGELPGTAAIVFGVEGYDLTATTMVAVKHGPELTKTPTASIASGTTVEKGTEITLSCATPNAVIYYTLDGSCPCDNNALIYDGTPIVINETTTLKMMAVAPNMYESEVAEYIYIVDTESAIEEISLDEDVMIYPLPIKDKLNVSAKGKTIRSIQIININGSIMRSYNVSAKKVSLNVGNLSAGTYIVNIVAGNKTFSKKVIKIE
jgi:uncharacterized repeat protein (TIGR02543 family)